MTAKPYEIAVCAMFRDAIQYQGKPNGTIPRFFQLAANQTLPVASTYYCFLEGDSVDGTWDALQKWTNGHANCHLIQRHTGENEEGSRRGLARFRRLARLGNELLEHACQQAKYVCWVEPDLLLSSNTFERLRNGLEEHPDWGAVAPFCRFGDQNYHYDAWAFREPDGTEWRGRPPHSPRYKPDAMLEMYSVGSCVMMRSEVLEQGALMGDEALVTLCCEIRARGYKVIADCRAEIRHPDTRKVGHKWMV